MRGGYGERHAICVTLAALSIMVGLGACGATKSITTVTTNNVGQSKLRLEEAIAGDALRNARHFWKGRFRFAAGTNCRATNAAGNDWKCRTALKSTRRGTSTCRMKTVVHGGPRSFHYRAPLPFARDVFSEACPTLHSQLSNS
jgi:hypothetical protein